MYGELLFVLYMTASLVDVTVAACRFPPSLWCSSEAIARECQVEYQCQNYLQTVQEDMVHFTLYYESLCPDCKVFMTNQLGPAYKAVGSIMDLELVPYGNAREEKNGTGWSFQCQHGPEECTGNLIEVCAIHLLKNVSAYFPFIQCMEKSSKRPAKSAAKCAKQLQIDLGSIMKCAEGQMGNNLEHEMAEKTNKLDPPHKFVPWVTLNGVHTKKIQDAAEENLTKLICDTYKGTKKPVGCDERTIFGCSNVHN